MRKAFAVLPLLMLGGCAFTRAPEQAGVWGDCNQFAWSGGYPVASGADYGGNPNFLYLPGEAPVWISREPIIRHLEIQDALRSYCERRMVPGGMARPG
jgi:hypothetical protein